jgi:hypothetical protein
MRQTTRQIPARFGRDVRFDVKTTPFRAEQTGELERLKNRLLKQLLDEAADPDQVLLLRRAANEAAALAWVTCFPLLLFPGLLEEKIRTALRQCERQARVRQRSRHLLLEAA